MRTFKSVTVPKIVKVKLFGIFQHPFYCKMSGKLKEGPYGAIVKF